MAQIAPNGASTVSPPPTGPQPPVPAPTGPRTPGPKKAPPAETKSSPPKHSGGIHAVWVVLVLVIVGAVIGFLIYKNRKRPPGRTPPPITISTTNAMKGNIDETVWALGTVTPIYTAMISPRVDGQLLTVNYTEGQMVKTNDLLAEIDPGPYQAMLTQAQGQLARDQAQLEGAKIDLDRFQQAYLKKAIPKQQVDDQMALVHQDEGTVKYDEGQVENAKVQLAYCTIRAPINGRTGLRLIDPGNVVHAANTNALVVIAQLQPITVIFSVNEGFLPAIQRQLRAGHKMTIDAYNTDQTEKLATGTFLTTDTMIDTTTGTIRIKGLFENKDVTLFPNQFVNAKLIIDTLTNVTLIPTPAIQRNPQGAFVYVVTNKTVNVTNKTETVTTNESVVVMRTIAIGISDADITSVNGLAPGEVIATDNFNKLGDGMKVNVRQRGGEGQRGGRGGGEGRKGGAPGGKNPKEKKDTSEEDSP